MRAGSAVPVACVLTAAALGGRAMPVGMVEWIVFMSLVADRGDPSYGVVTPASSSDGDAPRPDFRSSSHFRTSPAR